MPDVRPHSAFWPRRLPRELHPPKTSLWTNLAISALRYRDKAAFIYCERTVTYADLLAQAEAVAGWLQHEAGVERGDRVLLFMQNCPQFVAAYYGILRADAVVVPVNPMNRAEELKHYLRDAQPKAVVLGGELGAVVAQANAEVEAESRASALLVAHYADVLQAPPLAVGLGGEAASARAALLVPTEKLASLPEVLAARHPLPEGATDWSQAVASARRPGPHTAGPDDLAVMPYTSGTTGFPKGCMHTHATVMHNTLGAAFWTNGTPEAVVLSVLPMFHVTGMIAGMHAVLYLGSTAVMQPRWNRDEAAALIGRHGVSGWTNISTMVVDLLASPRLPEYDIASLTTIGGGGAAMPQAVAQRLQDEFGLQYIEGYGLSETIAPTHTNPPDRAKLQCLGIPVFGTDARVVDPDTLAERGVDEVGEIVVNGPQVFLGYWRNPDATRATFVEIDGKPFFRTADLGRVDAEGYFFITDRLKRMINASGFKVWPAEVEALLYRHPAIQEACVIASKDPYRGETVKAVVVLREAHRGQVTPEDIIAWAHGEMAAYKAPRLVELATSLPKSGTGKVMWRKLQEDDAARMASAAGAVGNS